MRAIHRHVFLVLLLALTSCSSTHYYVVRHGEKLNNTDDSPLSAAGQQRAEALAETLADKNILHIFVSDKRRTQQTAAPTAERFNLSPRIIPIANTDQLIAEVKEIYGQPVLIVRHSEEIHRIVNALSPSDTIAPIGNRFNNLFAIKRTIYFGQTETQLERLTYGAP